MAVAFPLAPAPAYYAEATWPSFNGIWSTPSVIGRNGVFYTDGTPGPPMVTLFTAGPTAYSVVDYWGTTITTGSMSGSATTCTPTAPAGGWQPGWYRIYFTGASTDSLFGPSYGATSFCMIRPNPHFVTMPTNSPTGENLDPTMRGVMGAGPSRIQITDASNPNGGSGGGTLTNAQSLTATAQTYYANPNAPYVDPVRARPLWLQFPTQAYDRLQTTGAVSGSYLNVYAKDATTAAQANTIYVAQTPGTSNSATINVYYPNSSTLVETWTSTTATLLSAAINAGSAYIKAFVPGANASGAAGTLAVTAIGNAFWTGVVSVVSTLYALGVSYFEGPSNEPTLGVNCIHQMMLFQAAVHAGNASAKAIGPCSVTISDGQSTPLTGLNSWTTFLAGGGGAYCDGISFHHYNAINGDLNLGRTSLTAFTALLASYGLSGLPLWSTEATQAMCNLYGVYHPHRARYPLLQTLLLEQYGCPREQDPCWYDQSHGFWSFPTWFTNTDGSLNPHAVLYRVLAEETFGLSHSQILSFGTPGDNIFLGSVYSTPGGGPSVAVLMPASPMPGATVTLEVAGSFDPLTVVDCMGNASTVAVADNAKATIPVAELTYVRLPAGVSVTVYTFNNWAPAVNHATTATATLNGVAAPMLNDGLFMSSYTGTNPNPGVAFSTGSMPDTAVLTWSTPQPINRVLVWCGGAYQNLSALSDFDVQTTVDGSTWVTQQTVTKTGVSSFQHGTDQLNAGCQRETYWDEQSIFDVAFPTVAALGVRLNVRATSYGGEPDAAAQTANAQGHATQQLTLQEFQALNAPSLPTGRLMRTHGRAMVHS